MKNVIELFVQRKSREGKNGKTYCDYFLEANVKGKTIPIFFCPPDVKHDPAGYALLDLLFEGEERLPLVVEEGEMTNDKGEIIKFRTYKVRYIGDDGDILDFKLLPKNTSDKGYLKLIFG